MCIRSRTFWGVGGFDSTFGPGGGFGAEEGIDLVRRLWAVAPRTRMHYTPEIRFFHENASPYCDEVALQKTLHYARARGACFARHWRTSHLPRVIREIAKHMIGCTVFRGMRRQSRLLSLKGYVQGFFAYRSSYASRIALDEQTWLERDRFAD
jgi:hypothetical protein